MTTTKRACLVYTSSTAGERDTVRERLQKEGYVICEVEAEPAEVAAAQANADGLSDELRACIENADVCIFLVPDDPTMLDGIGGGIGAGNTAGKRVVAVLCGEPTSLPVVVDDLADAVVCVGSGNLIPAVDGEEVWEAPGKEPGRPRETKRIRCQ